MINRNILIGVFFILLGCGNDACDCLKRSRELRNEQSVGFQSPDDEIAFDLKRSEFLDECGTNFTPEDFKGCNQ